MIREMAERLHFPSEAIESLCSCEEKMQGSADDIKRAMESIYTPGCSEYIDIIE